MREAWDMMQFVNASYALTLVVTAGVLAWSWRAMVRAEARREKARDQ